MRTVTAANTTPVQSFRLFVSFTAFSFARCDRGQSTRCSASSGPHNLLAEWDALRHPPFARRPRVLSSAIGAPSGNLGIGHQFDAIHVGVNAGGEISVRHW